MCFLLQVLEFVSKTVQECTGVSVLPIRSQAMELALLQAPYRTFLKYGGNGERQLTRSIMIYCLPRTVTEYIQFESESSQIKSTIISGLTSSASDTLVVSYNLQAGKFEGDNVSQGEIWEAASSETTTLRNDIAASTLSALDALNNTLQKSVLSRKSGSSGGDVVIVVGSGGREHALAVAIARSPIVGKVICCPGNGGTLSEKQYGNPKICNMGKDQKNDTVIALTKDVNAKMVVVGPEAPLVDGLVDELARQCPDVLCFGPTQAAAELEASKAFTKDFLQEHNIPTAKYRNFTSVDDAVKYVESLDIENGDRQVVKASGLAAGKGVLLPTTKAETIEAVKEIMADKAFGNAGDTCVIESFLDGPEASCFALCDGKTAILMPAAQDHKRALNNDEGLNTGGMGAYAPAPCVTPDLQKEIEQMCIETVKQMANRGTPYVGLLYAGMM